MKIPVEILSEMISRLPNADTWERGDEIRFPYSEEYGFRVKIKTVPFIRATNANRREHDDPGFVWTIEIA